MKTNHSTFFPEEILEEILFRLQVRELLRLRCVCKSWCALIDNPRFIKKQHENQRTIYKEDGDMPLLCGGRYQFYLVSKRFEDVPLRLSCELERDSALHSSKNLEQFRNPKLAAVVNGIVLFVWYINGTFSNSYMGLWNPAIREFKVVPSCSRSLKSYCHGIAFGFDAKFNDFKIIISSIGCTANCNYEYEMYSLNTNSWKNIQDPPPNVQTIAVGWVCYGYIDGVYYWPCKTLERCGQGLVLSFDFSNEVFKILEPPPGGVYYWPCKTLERCGKGLVLSFDFSNEVFKILEPPPGDAYSPVYIAKYMDSLAYLRLTHNKSYMNPIRHYEIWVMTKSDDPGISSWKHLFTNGPFEGFDLYLFKSFRMDGDMIFTIGTYHSEFSYEREYESVLYNPTTNTFRRKFGLEFYCCYEYVESLFQLSNREVGM